MDPRKKSTLDVSAAAAALKRATKSAASKARRQAARDRAAAAKVNAPAPECDIAANEAVAVAAGSGGRGAVDGGSAAAANPNRQSFGIAVQARARDAGRKCLNRKFTGRRVQNLDRGHKRAARTARTAKHPARIHDATRNRDGRAAAAIATTAASVGLRQLPLLQNATC